MKNIKQPLNNDFKEFIEILNKHKVDYCITGGYAVAFHSEPRSTGDIDFYVAHTKANSEKAVAAIKEFYGEKLDSKFFDTKETVIVRMGLKPNQIEVSNGLTGLNDEELMKHRVKGHYYTAETYIIGLDDLIKNKGIVKDMETRGEKRLSDARDYETLKKSKGHKKGKELEL